MPTPVIQYVKEKHAMMSTFKSRRLAATLNLYSFGLMLLCVTEVQGQLEPTVGLITRVSSESAPTRQNSLPEDVWEGSGMSPFTPDLHHSQDYLSLPVQTTLVNTPFLPSLAFSSNPHTSSLDSRLVKSTGLHHSQDVESTETPWNIETSWLSGVDSSVIQNISHATPKTSLHLSARHSNVVLPLGSSYMSSGSGQNSLESNVNSTLTTDHRHLRLLRTFVENSSLKSTSCTPVSINEWPIMSASSKFDVVGCISSTVRDGFSNTHDLQSADEVSSIRPSIAASVSKVPHRTTETSKRPQVPAVPSSPVTTIQLTGKESRTTTPFLEKTHPSEEDTRVSHYTLFLRTKKCPFMFANELQKELSEKTFRSANYSTSRWNVLIESCTSHLNVSIRTKGPSSLDDLISQFNTLDRSNISIRVLNRTFYIVHIQKHVDFIENRTTFDSNSSSTFINSHEFPIYVSLGASFVAALVASIILCCINFCVKKLRKPACASRSSQIHRRFEDYTLTPIPRPSSLYVDYYRGSVIGDHYSTTSAGSITSTPTVEQGVVQPFDTCIVPLEDSEAIPEDTVKKPVTDSTAVAHVPNFSFHPNANPVLAHCITTKSDSNERLHPKYQKTGELKNSGLENPSFQKY